MNELNAGEEEQGANQPVEPFVGETVAQINLHSHPQLTKRRQNENRCYIAHSEEAQKAVGDEFDKVNGRTTPKSGFRNANKDDRENGRYPEHS